MHPLILLILLVASLLFISWLKRAPPAARTNAMILAAVAVLLLLTVTGRAHWIFPAIAAVAAIAHRVVAVSRLFNMFKSTRGSRGRSSDIETEFIHMSLNHDTGELDGEVLKGKYRGRNIGNLSLEELLELYDACVRDDEQSAAVLEAFLDRYHEGVWRERLDPNRQAAPPQSNGGITREDACKILGVPHDASLEQIVEAHRRLMQRVHPDRGGSAYLAAQLNQAKEVLLKGASSRDG